MITCFRSTTFRHGQYWTFAITKHIRRTTRSGKIRWYKCDVMVERADLYPSRSLAREVAARCVNEMETNMAISLHGYTE